MKLEAVNSTPTNDEFLKLAAWHEAGHAVMRWVLGMRVVDVVVFDKAEPGLLMNASGEELKPWDQLLYLLSGEVAEAHVVEHDKLRPFWTDFVEIGNIIEEFGSPHDEILSLAVNCTHTVLNQHGDLMDALVAELVETYVVSEARMSALCLKFAPDSSQDACVSSSNSQFVD